MEVTTKNGYTFLVDDEDVDVILEGGWFGRVLRKQRVNGEWGKAKKYIVRTNRKSIPRRTESLSRYLMNAPDWLNVDHVNGDTLDNRKQNLRLCSHSQNGANQDKHLNNTSGYKCVHWVGRESKWGVNINVEGRRKHVGYFDSKEKAALAYNNAALKFFGEFARLNEVEGVTYGS